MPIIQMLMAAPGATETPPAELVGANSAFQDQWYVPAEVILPSGIQAGDLIVAAAAGTTINGIEGSGWTAAVNSSSQGRIYHKFADGNESGDEVNFSTDFGADGNASAVFVFRNATWDSGGYNGEDVPSHVFPPGGGFSLGLGNTGGSGPAGWTEVGSTGDRVAAYRLETEGSSAASSFSSMDDFVYGYVHAASQ